LSFELASLRLGMCITLVPSHESAPETDESECGEICDSHVLIVEGRSDPNPKNFGAARQLLEDEQLLPPSSPPSGLGPHATYPTASSLFALGIPIRREGARARSPQTPPEWKLCHPGSPYGLVRRTRWAGVPDHHLLLSEGCLRVRRDVAPGSGDLRDLIPP